MTSKFETQVKLEDGRLVSSWSEEWRLECLRRFKVTPVPDTTCLTMVSGGVNVSLSSSDSAWATRVGTAREKSSVSKRFTNRNGAGKLTPDESLAGHILGAKGELAVARVLDIEWPASVDAKKGVPDIPPDWQVRTRSHHHYDLIVREDDKPTQRFVLVTSAGTFFRVHGWIMGSEARNPEWLRDRGGRYAPCYWVPKSALHNLTIKAST